VNILWTLLLEHTLQRMKIVLVAAAVVEMMVLAMSSINCFHISKIKLDRLALRMP
jgi:hypothetical protein